MDAMMFENRVGLHPWVWGELILGKLGEKAGEGFLSDLSKVSQTTDYPISEVLDFIQEERLSNQGIGLVDTQLLYSALAGENQLWTFDKNLAKLAKHYGVAFDAHVN